MISLRACCNSSLRWPRQQAIRALEIAPESREESAVAAILLSRAGDISRADAIAKDLEQHYPLHAVVQSYWLPCIRAQISLAGKDPASALQQLEKASAFDILFPQVAFYSPMFSVVLRAEAYSALDQPAAAAKEWARISQFPGIVQLSATAPISKLQFARALARQAQTGDPSAHVKARLAYQDFLSLWKEADADIPVWKAAQAEFAALNKIHSPVNPPPLASSTRFLLPHRLCVIRNFSSFRKSSPTFFLPVIPYEVEGL